MALLALIFLALANALSCGQGTIGARADGGATKDRGGGIDARGFGPAPDGGVGGATGGGGGLISTDTNLKVAFIGDTADGPEYAAVLRLIKAEGAAAYVVAGDMTYSADPDSWWEATEAEMGEDFPVFIARGNHDDSSWSGFLPKAAEHLGDAVRIAGKHEANYKTIFRGLAMVAIEKGDGPEEINDLFAGDNHRWRICLWHQNQQAMNVGGKGDEMGWEVYEACRELGAIIQTGHEHTYSRTKTLTNMTAQTIDPGCPDGQKLCVGPGSTFVNVVGLGGTGVRDQEQCLPSATSAPFPSIACPYWAAIYTETQGATHGAQFIVFNVDGDPRKARGYFKNVDGVVVDEFEITSQ
jgi:predicted phosphodiesterase